MTALGNEAQSGRLIALLFLSLACTLSLAPDSAAANEGAKTIFITEQGFKGDFGGLTMADALCQEEAEFPSSIVPQGKYLAWLSDDKSSPRDRLADFSNPIVLPDGTVVADSCDDLTDGSIQHAINMTASGESFGALSAWTGTKGDGTHMSLSTSCYGWTKAQQGIRGITGSTLAVDHTWTNYQSRTCYNTLRLICIQR